MTPTQTHAALLSDAEIAQCINQSRTNLFDRAGTTSFRIARAIEQAVIAKLQPAQEGELPDDREAFESWYAKHASDVIGIDVTSDEIANCRVGDGYSEEGSYLNGAWAGYRAALAARKPLTGLTREQMEAGRHQVFSTNNPFCPCDSKTFRKVSEWTEREFCRVNGLEVKT